MAKRMSDDEVMDYTYNKLFGDLDNIRSGSMFSTDEDATNDVTDGAGKAGIEGINITVKPVMAGAAEGARPDDVKGDDDDEEPEDKLRGIGKFSPLMAQLHGDR